LIFDSRFGERRMRAPEPVATAPGATS